MSDIPARLRTQVVRRAGNRCEYCRLSQAGQEAAFHIDHVVPVSASGPTQMLNLALGCVSCSLRTGSRLTATDPESGEEIRLFQSTNAIVGGPFPLGSRKACTAHVNWPCNCSRSSAQSPVDSRDTTRGSGARTSSSGMNLAAANALGDRKGVEHHDGAASQ
jgi:hypothetical protein